jgi:hypothetical protein
VPIRLAAGRFVPPVAGIKTACRGVTPTPNGSAVTGSDIRK